jgi:hypothetical protein
VGGSGQCAEGNNEFERGHGSGLSWSFAVFINLLKRFIKLKKRRVLVDAEKEWGRTGKLKSMGSRCPAERHGEGLV